MNINYKGPAWTERALFCRISKDGEKQSKKHISLSLYIYIYIYIYIRKYSSPREDGEVELVDTLGLRYITMYTYIYAYIHIDYTMQYNIISYDHIMTSH